MKVSKLFKRLMEESPADGGAGGGAPAPAPAAPVGESAPQPTPTSDVDTGSDSDFDWEKLSHEMDDDEILASGEDEETPPAPPVQQPPQPTEPQQQAADAALQQQPPVQPEQQAPQQPAQPVTPEAMKEAEQAYLQQLETLYRFDDDTAIRLQTEPEKVLPSLAAKLHMDVMRTVLAQVNGMLPQAMQEQTQAFTRETKAKDMFYSAWPELREHEAEVVKVGKMFRELNPSAPADVAVQKIGELVMVSLGKTRAASPSPEPTPAAAPAFRPAAPGRVSAPAPSPSIWEDMATDDD